MHLYKRYLSDEQAQRITQKLEALDYNVKANVLVFPDEIQKSTIVYSPFIDGEKNLDSFIAEIGQLGWPDVELQALFKGNHWYSKNSIGLFLIPEGVKQTDKMHSQDLVNQYNSEQCEVSAQLFLKRDQTYQLLYTKDPNTLTEHKTGTWTLTGYPYIELTSSNGDWRFYFEIHQSNISDVVGKVDLLQLKPLSSHHVYPNCVFSFGVRS